MQKSKAHAKKSAARQPAATAGLSDEERKLMAIDPQHFVIQLIGMRDPADLRAYFSKLSRDVVFLTYERQLAGKSFHVAVHGDFANAAEASRAIKQLPEKVRRQKPWAKKAAAVQKEIQTRLAAR